MVFSCGVSLAAAASLSCRRPVMMTSFPSSTNFFANASPMPPDPPVMRIVFPENFMFVLLLRSPLGSTIATLQGRQRQQGRYEVPTTISSNQATLVPAAATADKVRRFGCGRLRLGHIAAGTSSTVRAIEPVPAPGTTSSSTHIHRFADHG